MTGCANTPPRLTTTICSLLSEAFDAIGTLVKEAQYEYMLEFYPHWNNPRE